MATRREEGSPQRKVKESPCGRPLSKLGWEGEVRGASLMVGTQKEFEAAMTGTCRKGLWLCYTASKTLVRLWEAFVECHGAGSAAPLKTQDCSIKACRR